MASTFVCVLFALAAHGAVLDTQDTILKRIVRSPSCGTCSEHPHPLPPPPPPSPFGRGPPPPPPGFHTGSSASNQASSFKEADFPENQHDGEFQQNTFNSGSRASAQAVAGQYDKFARRNGFSGNSQGGGFRQNGFNSGSSASAQAMSGAAGGFNGQDSDNGFPGNRHNLGNGFQEKGFNAGSSASAQAVNGIGGGFDKHGPKYGFPGNHENLGNGFQKNGFNTGSATSEETGKGVAGSYDRFSHEEEFSEKQQALGFQQKGHGGAFRNVNEGSGVQAADKQGCSSCAKGGSAVSNAKSHSGSATAIAVNNG